jgi:site-specific recombinase XerC
VHDLAAFLETPAARLQMNLRRVPDLVDLTREQLELFFADHNSRFDPNYTAIHYRGLRRWFNWLVEEGDIQLSPMRRIPAPQVRDEPTPVLDLETIRKLLKACQGQTFNDRRDTALIRFLIDTGVRLGGITAVQLDDVDLDRQQAMVIGKGGDRYLVDLGAKAVRDLDRYLRVRAQHRYKDSPMFWVGMFGPLTESAVYQLVRRRATQAGIHIEKAVHVFRHSFSHHFRMAGGDEGDLQVLGGWKSRAMLGRYGKSLAVERARAAHRRFSPGDQV